MLKGYRQLGTFFLVDPPIVNFKLSQLAGRGQTIRIVSQPKDMRT